MELGAFVVIPQNPCTRHSNVCEEGRASATARPMPLWPVVGRNLLQEWIERIRRIGVQVLSVTHSAKVTCDRLETAWGLAKEGVEQLLVVSLKSYAEIDLVDFVQFHRERRNSATEAFDPEGPLGVEIVNRPSLASESSAQYRPPAGIKDASKYSFRGYAKRLRSPKVYRDLVSDALLGRCALTPQGSQIEEHVWIGEQTRIADSVRFFGPCFVGDGTVLQDGVSMGPFSSVENECRIDCGTTLEGSSILPNTFLAAGLSVRHSIVDGPYLEQLDSGTIVDLRAAGLARRFHPRTRTRRDDDGERQFPTWSQRRHPPTSHEPRGRAAAMIATDLT
ncbi:MAG: hypothetical protein WB952_01590 [Terriglobales bacterium]